MKRGNAVELERRGDSQESDVLVDTEQFATQHFTSMVAKCRHHIMIVMNLHSRVMVLTLTRLTASTDSFSRP